jgi:hypothetical protein
MVILRATSNLGGQKEDNGMMCSITQKKTHCHGSCEDPHWPWDWWSIFFFSSFLELFLYIFYEGNLCHFLYGFDTL